MQYLEFRFWDKIENTMHYPVKAVKGEKITKCPYVIGGFGQLFDISLAGIIRIVEHLKPLQYTGLKDKNGKKIFEGDIVKSVWKEHIIGEVKFGQYTDSGIEEDIYTKDRFGFYVENGDRQDTIIGLGEKVWFEVIGNIHEHKQLLND